MILAQNQKIFNFLVDMVPYLVTEGKGFQTVICSTVCEPLATNTQSSNTEGKVKETSASFTVDNTQIILKEETISEIVSFLVN